MSIVTHVVDAVKPTLVMDDAEFRSWIKTLSRLAFDQIGEVATPPMAWVNNGDGWRQVNTTPAMTLYHPPCDEPRPTAGPEFVPTPELDAERLGLELADNGESARAPGGWPYERLEAFYSGWLAGRDRCTRADHDAWLEERREVLRNALDLGCPEDCGCC